MFANSMFEKLFLRRFLMTLLFAAPWYSLCFGQVEHWDTYMANYDGKPGSVLVDLGLKANAPDQRYTYLVITGPEAHNCDHKGLPDRSEIETLEQILDATGDFITGVTAKMLAGTFTYHCQRLNYYYVKDTVGIRNALHRLYNRNYKDYEFVLNMKHDAYWRTYLTFLYPNDATLNWMENDKVIVDLLQHGDSLKTKRDIVFAACFNQDTTKTKFENAIREHGFKIEKSRAIKGSEQPLCLYFSTFNTVSNDTISKYSSVVKQLAAQYGGSYKGWDATLKN